jgi:hypothetical protein
MLCRQKGRVIPGFRATLPSGLGAAARACPRSPAPASSICLEIVGGCDAWSDVPCRSGHRCSNGAAGTCGGASAQANVTTAAQVNAPVGGWSVTPSPNPRAGNGLFGAAFGPAVSCPTTSVCTAVGLHVRKSGLGVTLAERRSGGVWTVQSTPNPPGAAASALGGTARDGACSPSRPRPGRSSLSCSASPAQPPPARRSAGTSTVPGRL